MDFDIPTDLINKAQIGFKQAAGLSSFDREGPTPSSIPSVEASISSLDPSPSYLRCRLCQGKLLRGIQSLICVYCGGNQKKDLHPEPISFSSTHGYSWLLQSLNFNGSERVGSLAEGSGIDGGHSPAEDELTLSELLDLKISWTDKPEKLENNFKIETSEHNISLNLGTTDFDQFFTKSMSKSAIVSDNFEDQPVASKADQDKIVEGQENFASDWNAEFQFADTKMENEEPRSAALSKGAEADQNKIVESQENFTSDWDAEFQFADTRRDNEKPGSVDLFAGAEANLSANMDVGQEDLTSDWNAEFQFADTRMENEKPGSVDLFVGAEADLSAQMDVRFEPTESFDFKRPNQDSDPFQVDLFANMSSATFQQNEQFDAVVQSKDDLSGDLNNYELKNVDGDWFSDGNWQKRSVKATLNDDSITDWFDNTNWQKDGTNNHVATIKDDNNTLNDGSLQDNPNDSLTDWFANTNWQKSSANNTATIKDDDYTLNDMSLQNYPNDTSTDWLETTNWQKDGSNNNAATIQDDNLFDIKPQAKDLIQSERSDIDNSDKQRSDVTDWFQNSQWAVGGSSSTANIAASKDDDKDVFGDWNDFTSSAGNKDSFQASWKESGNEKVDFGTSEKKPELDLFQSTVASPEVDFGNFLQSDMFSGDRSRNDAPTMDDIFTAIRSANSEAGNSAVGSKNDEIIPNATTSPKDDVQMLMSQMHDLSFMLKNELSFPSKPNDIGPSHT